MQPFARAPSSLRLLQQARQPTWRTAFPFQTFAVRPLSISPPLRLKEDKAQDPQEIEKAKQEQAKTGKAKQELQSASEEAVGADQQEVKDTDKHIEELQKKTAQQKEQEK